MNDDKLALPERSPTLKERSEKLLALARASREFIEGLKDLTSHCTELTETFRGISDQIEESAEYACLLLEAKEDVEQGNEPEHLIEQLKQARAAAEAARNTNRALERRLSEDAENNERKLKKVSDELGFALAYGMKLCGFRVDGVDYAAIDSSQGRLTNWYTNPGDAIAQGMIAARAYSTGGLTALVQVRDAEKGGRP